MKTLLRSTGIYAIALFILPSIVQGFKINGTIVTYIFSAFALTLMFVVVKPVINLISFPLNLVTLGLFSTITNVLILYLLTIFVSEISISGYMFSGASIAGVVIPKFYINQFLVFALCAFVISFIASAIAWVMK